MRCLAAALALVLIAPVAAADPAPPSMPPAVGAHLACFHGKEKQPIQVRRAITKDVACAIEIDQGEPPPSAGAKLTLGAVERATDRFVPQDDGVALAKKRYARKDAADPAADAPRFDLKLHATAAGDHALEVDVRFWLCGAKVCRPVRAHRTITVHATAPAAAPPPAG